MIGERAAIGRVTRELADAPRIGGCARPSVACAKARSVCTSRGSAAAKMAAAPTTAMAAAAAATTTTTSTTT